jgi:RHS repeat-associated protein
LAAIATASASLFASAGTITYYHNDLLGSPVAATNASGQVTWRETYRPYGERLTNDANSAGNKIWYTSRRQDADTGLVYMGARYYDPVVARFMGMDPKAFDETNIHSFNRYAYANNNPLRYRDPDGLDSIDDTKAAIKDWWSGSVAGFKSEGPWDASMRALSALPAEAGLLGAVGAMKSVSKSAIAATRELTPEAASAAANFSFKTEHYSSRLAEAGLDVTHVESSVARYLDPIRPHMVEGADVGTRIKVGDVAVEARARLLQDGIVSVGTIFPVK